MGLVSAFRDGHDNRRAELVSMWVAPTARSRGLGALLVNDVLTWAQSAGDIESITLCVIEGNDTALRFYERLGFVSDDVHPLVICDGVTGYRLTRRIRWP